MTSFGFEPIYGSLLIALAIAAATVGLIALVTPPSEDPRHRRWLVILRSVAALSLLSVVFRPSMIRTDNRPADATLVVAVDVSRSMTLPDGDGGDRWTRQVKAWRELASGLSGLDRSLAIRLIAYDRSTRRLVDAGPGALDEETPQGELTDLAAAASAAIQAAEGNPMAGVVMMGDGAQTAPLRGTGAQRVVETLNSIGVPLWCVPIGPAGGAGATRDVAIDALPESYQLFAGNEVNIDFQVMARGLSGVEVPVRVSWIDAAGKVDEVATRTVVPALAENLEAFSIPLLVPPPGTYRLKVEATAQDGELVTVNNSQVAFVDVREGGGRVLYLEGALREEQLRIRQALRGFPDLDLTYRWIPSDTSQQWPVDLDDWFRPGRFDVYLIGDLDASAIGTEQLGELADAVSRGAGLVTLGGRQVYGTGGYADSPLSDVIPLKMDPSRRRDVSESRNESDGQLSPPVQVRLARAHPITDLGGQDPSARWQTLPPQLGANRLLGPKVAPGVQTLLETPNQAPLLVVGEYGSGRTAALAMDSTYRWWRAGQRDTHKRFWRQMMLWLLNRDDIGDDKILIDLPSRRFDISEPPEFRARAESLGGPPIVAELVAEIIDESQNVTSIAVSTENDPDGGSAIRGKIPELPTGFYQLVVRPADANSPLESQSVAFQTIDQSREMARPMADPVYLRQLAQLTAEHGGAAYSPDEIDQLVETISQRRRRAETPIIDKYRLGDGPLSGWIVFLIFAGALAAEWILRRRWGIV